MQGDDSISEEALTLSDAEALVAEIERLQAQVEQLKQRVSQLDHLAHCDPLVGLPNRRSFIEQLERNIARVGRYGEQSAMLFVDMDGLKRINDRFGHTAGDQALTRVSQLLVSSVRKSDYVARIGGDEFGVLLERIDERGAWEMALRIVETVVASEFAVEGCALPLSVAVGVGSIRADDSAQSVIERADKEMYRVKAA